MKGIISDFLKDKTCVASVHDDLFVDEDYSIFKNSNNRGHEAFIEEISGQLAEIIIAHYIKEGNK